MQCAIDHCDVHLRKQIVETAQILSTAHVVLDNNQVAYKKTHMNHPCSKWARESSSNYLWTIELLKYMVDEYHYRFNKTHKTAETIPALSSVPKNIRKGSLTRFVQAMPDEYKRIDVTEGYEIYLRVKFKEWGEREKPIKVAWTKRDIPAWMI